MESDYRCSVDFQTEFGERQFSRDFCLRRRSTFKRIYILYTPHTYYKGHPMFDL